MNILQVVPDMNAGGMETCTVDLAKELVRLGHKAVVVSNGGELTERLAETGARHYRLPVHRRSIVTMARMVSQLIRIIRNEDIDIVHARSRVPAWIAWAACRVTGTVFITTCHGYYPNHFFSRVMGWGRRVIVISGSVGRHMVEDFRVPCERIRLIPRSVDLSRFPYSSPERKRRGGWFSVGIIGRVTPRKGHAYFFKAMAGLRECVPGLRLKVVGDAPDSRQAYMRRLLCQVDDLGLAGITEFMGVCRDIPAILSRLDLLVLATTTPEAFGRVIVEAQASGVPVVATKVGGATDIIDDGVTGLLVPPADPDAMREAALKVYRDRDLARYLARNAYHKVAERYSLDQMVRETVVVYEDALSDKKTLVLKFTSVGDLILATASLKAIRERFRHDTITVLAGPEGREILSGCPYVDEVLVYDPKGGGRGWRGFLQTARTLRRARYDTVIDLQNGRKSHLLSYLTGARDRFGYDNGKLGFLLNRSIRDTKTALDPVNHQFAMLRAAGVRQADPRLELWPQDADRRYIDDLLREEGLRDGETLVGINMAASPRWESKNWPLRHMAELCRKLAGDMRVVVTGMEKGRELAARLCSLVPECRVINACSRTSVNQLACLIKRCSVYVSPDSAPLHIAASQDTPFVALFGPTNYRRHLPPSRKCVVIQKKVACGPCYSSKCGRKTCMELISAAEVEAAVRALLRVPVPRWTNV